MPKIIILCFLIRPKFTILWSFKKSLNANNGNIYRDDGIIFGMNVHIIQIQILRSKFRYASLLTRSLFMKIIKSSKIMSLVNNGRKKNMPEI